MVHGIKPSNSIVHIFGILKGDKKENGTGGRFYDTAKKNKQTNKHFNFDIKTLGVQIISKRHHLKKKATKEKKRKHHPIGPGLESCKQKSKKKTLVSYDCNVICSMSWPLHHELQWPGNATQT